MTDPQASEGATPPDLFLKEILHGYQKTLIVCAAAALGLADHLAHGPKSAKALAEEVGADPGALYRLLRALASIGIFEELEGQVFAQNAHSEPLKTDAPESVRNLAEATLSTRLPVWLEIVRSVTTGQPSCEKVHGKQVGPLLARPRETSRAFARNVDQQVRAAAAGLASTYDFSPFRSIVDVGGGTGRLVAEVLKRFPEARAISFDLPEETEGARALLNASNLGGRAEAVAGSFLESIPSGGDLYILKGILEAWDDDQTVTLLTMIRNVIDPNGRLLVVEALVSRRQSLLGAKFPDINKLIMTGGRHRTAAEFGVLFGAARFEVSLIDPDRWIIEGRPV